MSCVQCCKVLTFIMVIMIGKVKGRWLEVEPYSTSSMVSDGIDYDMSHDNSSGYIRMGSLMLDGEKRCQSIYGFMPCADTMPEGVFLMIMYTYLMMLGEDWIRKGSQALFLLLGDKKIGASVFRVLMALPRIVLVVVAGFVSTEEAAQNQVAFGVSMYAGSTLITLTLIWGCQIILRRDKLRGKGSPPKHDEHQQNHSSTNSCWSLIIHKLSILNDTGVNIHKETTDVAVIMLLSLIPFAIVELVPLVNNPIMILFALVFSGGSLISYFAYQIGDPLIRYRSLAYLKQEELQKRLFFHVKRVIKEDLTDADGNPNFNDLQRVFNRLDTNNDNAISLEELEDLIAEVFQLKTDDLSKEYAKAEIMTHFDDDDSGNISWEEFENGCKKWLEKWMNVPNISDSVSKRLWKKVQVVVIKNKQAELTQMDNIMPKILRQLDFDQHGLVTPDRKADRQKIERLFSKYDEDGDGKLDGDELKKFIKKFRFGISVDRNTIMNNLVADFSNNTANDTIHKYEFVEGLVKWTEKYIHPSNKDPLHELRTEEDSWTKTDESPNTVKPKAGIVYVIFGIGVMYLISGAFMQSVLQFSNAANIPFHLTSFVVFPIAMNARMIITALLNTGSRVAKNASLTFFEIYGGLVMNNLLGLLTLLIIVHMKRLSWTYSNEVLIIMIPCAIVGLFALKRDTYPLWASILAMLLYPTSICLYYVMYS